MNGSSRRGFLRNSLASCTAPAAVPRTVKGNPLAPAAWIPRTLEGWKAHWIWDDYNRETTNIFVCLRKVVTLDGAARQAHVWATANSFYRLYINGVEAGRGPEPNEPPFKFYDYHELGKLFRRGENVVAVLAYNLGIGTHFYGAGPGGFLLEAHLEMEDGGRVEMVTDRSWRVAVPRWYSRYAPQMLWASGFQETCDLRKVAPEWNSNPTETGGIRWRWASEFGVPPVEPFTILLPREIPYERRRAMAPARVIHSKLASLPEDWLVRQAETMSNPNPNIATRMSLAVEAEAPAGLVSGAENLLRDDASVAVVEPPPPGRSARVLVDFGEEVVGQLAIDFAGMNGGVLDIGYSEFLKKGDRIDLLRDVLQCDRVILGQGARQWESYDRRAFRYLLLDLAGLRGPLKIRRIDVGRAAYPVEYAGRFESSDRMLDRIWEVCRRSCELNMHDHYEDGPVRERGQYAGDVRTTSLWNYYLFGDRLLAAKFLRHFARMQREDGWFKTLSPSGTRHNIVEMMLQWVITIWEYYWFTGDEKLARELAPHAYRAVRWFEQYTGADGLIAGADRRDWWIFIDWGEFDFRDEIAGLNLWYFQGLMAAVRLAGLRGDAAEAERFGGLAKRVRAGIERRFWNPAENAYVDCWTRQGPSRRITRQPNYMAILSGAAPRERWGAMVDRVTRPDIARITTPYFKYFELDCWLRAGRPLAAVLDEARAWWGEQVRRGATTFWEEFDDRSAPDSVPGGTCCHSWTGGPVVILGSEVLGVWPTAPGFAKVRIRPRWGGLEHARGVVPTPRGPIAVAWDRRKKRLEVELPELEAELDVWSEDPSRRQRKVLSGGGHHEFEI